MHVPAGEAGAVLAAANMTRENQAVNAELERAATARSRLEAEAEALKQRSAVGEQVGVSCGAAQWDRRI